MLCDNRFQDPGKIRLSYHHLIQIIQPGGGNERERIQARAAIAVARKGGDGPSRKPRSLVPSPSDQFIRRRVMKL